MIDRLKSDPRTLAIDYRIVGTPINGSTPHAWYRYGLAVTVCSAALAVSLAFRSTFENSPFLLFWVAVILSAIYGGLGPGLVASFLCATAINYFFLDTSYGFSMDPESVFQIGTFLLAAGAISYLYERRRRAEMLLGEQSKWFQTTLAGIGDAVIATDLHGRIVFLNEVASRLTSWAVADAIGQDIETVFHIVNEDTRLPVVNPALRAIREGRIVGLANHTILLRKDGTGIYIDDSGAPLYDDNGQAIGAVLVFRDISESRQKDRALQISEERFRAAQNVSLDAFTVLETVRDEATGQIVDFRWMYVNPEAGRILKHPPEALMGQRLLEVLPGNKENSELFERYVRVVETGEPHDLELYYESDGIDGWFRNMAVRLGDGLAVSFSDITERKRIEVAERKERLLAEALRDIALARSSRAALPEVLEVILGSIERVVPYETADVVLCEGALARIACHRGYPEGGPGGTLIPNRLSCLDYPLLRQAAESRSPVVVDDISLCEDWVSLVDQEWRRSYVCVPILLQRESIGFLNVTSVEVGYFSPDLTNRLVTLSNQIALAVSNARLMEQALLAAATQERERLARDLHDAVSQTLFAATLIAESVPRQWKVNPEKVLPLLDQLRQLTHGAQAEMRTLLLELRPTALLEADLKTLLPQLADAIQSRKRIDIALNIDEPPVLPPDVKLSLYRITQEALNNIAKHSDATQASVHLRHQPGQIELMVSDNGRGFDLTSVGPTSLGLGIMRERAAEINASLTITAQPGSGTRIQTLWPGA